MSSLIALADDKFTDKNTIHSYLPLYEKLLSSRAERARAVLEVGIYHGGSIAMWHSFFPNAQVYGLDITREPPPLLKNYTTEYPRMVLKTGTDAYTASTVSQLQSEVGKFDFVLDDGPHTLASMVSLIVHYLPIVADDGILIIEDVQDVSWFTTLRAAVPDEFKSKINIYDLRAVKGRYDDLVFVVDKSA